jgi:excisionase family DNA binding protein
VDNVQGYLTVREAAEQLGISEKTVRRRIKNGSLPAELKQGDYGQQYFIPADAIETAQAITDVVEVKRVYDVQALSMAVVQALDERNKTLESELATIREELAATREALQKLQETLTQQQRPRAWWRFWEK